MSLNDTTSPAGYIDLLSQINPQSLTGFDPNIGSSQAQMFHLRDPMASSKLMSNTCLHSLLENDRLACKDSDTSLVAQLKRQLTESQHAVASLQADRLRLINENAGLNSTCQALQNVIVNIRGSMSSVASTSSSLSACDTSNIISNNQKPLLVGEIVAEECDRELDRKDYPSIRSWMKKEWQDEKGEPVLADCAKSIRNHMLSSFRQLQSQGLAPVSIGQASLQVLRPVPPKLPPTSIDSSTSIVSSSSESNPAVVLPSHIITPVSMTDISSSSNSTSLANLASLAVKMELVNANTIDSKADAIKKRQPSTKPMRVSPKITAWNLCALEWQSNGHQKEPASVFATYWNRLSTADKELYKRKAAVQLSAPGLAQADDNQDE
ncbi:uncharacterized protein BJ212DRAFT_1299023 [Suillus subaureus]|uniref:Uncharacterized protein n=1 Tax=Suillus subaureus TaxID=48587 RepID=A0A9P7ED64_9AGAM|nr:uncharacterized protein BJ212DRAFT_1299023 [Suillus subaureus]KAG1818205.1 hypothetical protein BJ212DRAFT_1299023 [Suillus subaureus]